MNNYIITDEKAREKIGKGVDVIGDVVGISLGPKGRNVGLDFGYEVNSIHDGVKISRQIKLKDAGENWAVRIVRQSAEKQLKVVGDGTTVVCLLTQAIYKECVRNIVAGTNAMSLQQGLRQGRDILLEELKKQAIPIKTKKQAIEIATVSSADIELGKQIGELVYELGAEGVITVEKSNGRETYTEKQEGMQFDKGYISQYLITDGERMEATIENPRILISDKTLNNINEMLPLLEQFTKANERNIVIIAPDIIDSALASFIMTKQRGGMNILAVKAPYAAQAQKDFLNDIAIATGGIVISQDAGRRFESVTLDELGQAERITSTEDATIIVGGKGDKEVIVARIASLRTLQERDEGSDYQKEKLKERIAKLSNGIGVVNVGGDTEVEINEKYERADDAVKATQAALKEGIVAGGETIYLKIREELSKFRDPAYTILYDALEKPFHKLLTNAGMKPDAFLMEIKGNMGVDVVYQDVKDMIKFGIIDPVLVAKEAIINSISSAITLMTTEALILPEEEEKK